MDVRRYPNFDWMRLAFALMVVVHHINSASRINAPIPMSVPMVPAFLALSGFLVLQSWERSRGMGHFWRKRFLRVIPAMSASLVLTTALLGWHPLVDSLMCYISLGLVMDYSGNAPLWSLGCEEILYFTLTILATIGVYKKRPWIILLALIPAIWLYAATIDASQKPQRIFPLPAAFLIGNLVYVYREKLLVLAQKYAVPFVIIAISIRMTEQAAQGWVWPILNAPGHWIPYSLVVLGVVLLGLSRQTDKPGYADLSYGCYVYHWPIITKLVKSGVTGIALFPITLTLTILIAALSWKYIEKPCLAFKSKPLRSKGDTVEALT